MAIWIDISLISLLVAAAALWPLLRRSTHSSAADTTEADEAIAVEKRLYQQRLNELDADIARGVLDEGAAQEARAELGRALLASAERAVSLSPQNSKFIQPILIVMVLLAIGCAYGVYWKIGAPTLHGQPIQSIESASADQVEIQTAIVQVEEQMLKTPDDVRGWRVLAPIYRRMGESDKAIHALHQILALDGPTVEAQTELAEMLLLVEGDANRNEAKQLLGAARETLPNEVKPRFLLAVIAMQENEFDLASELWRGLLTDLDSNGGPEETWVEIAREGLVQAQAAETATDATAGAAQIDPTALNPTPEEIEAIGSLNTSDRQEVIKNMVESLGQRLQNEGGTLAEWQRYIRSLTVLGETQQAEDARDLALENLSDPTERSELEALANELGLAQPDPDTGNTAEGTN